MTEPKTLSALAQALLTDLQALEARLERLRKEIEKAFPLQVRWRYKRCGKVRCRCARGERHGPYPYGYLPDEEVNRRRREGKGTTRKEVYLGRGWNPPEGWTEPHRLKTLLKEYQDTLERRDQLVERLERARAALEGREVWTGRRR
ncbi:MAG: DUF6788 family protein [Thermus sp.]|uniref:DUF6788 family protein n=1 Tax=Thermus sp. TaxID=275 RepID=UPI00298EE286|nr:DUF6788 family protein [Thermus sp.]MDW8018260.1 DUF6788 family protein [Thermus sp.]